MGSLPANLSKLAVAEVAALQDENPKEFLRLLEGLQELDGHWWCKASPVMTVILPSLLDDQSIVPRLRIVVAKQLRLCIDCMKKYHAGKDAWEAQTDMSPRRVEQVRVMLLRWDAERLVPDMRKTARQMRNTIAMAEAQALDPYVVGKVRDHCDRILLEMLLDARLTMNPDVSVAIGDMFAVYTPYQRENNGINLLTDDEDMLAPGVYVLSVHPSPAARGWARRCIAQHSEDCSNARLPVMSKGLESLFTACIHSLREHYKIPHTRQAPHEGHHSMQLECSTEEQWYLIHTLLKRLRSAKDLRRVLHSHPQLIKVVACGLDSLNGLNVQVLVFSLQVLCHFVSFLKGTLWQEADCEDALSVLQKATSVYSNCLSMDAQLTILELLEPFALSARELNFGVYRQCLQRSLEFLNRACSGPDSSMSIDPSTSGDLSEAENTEALKVLATRELQTYATIIVHCYRFCSGLVVELDGGRLAVLLEVMFSDKNLRDLALDLLTEILMTDARNLVRALTTEDIASLAFSAAAVDCLLPEEGVSHRFLRPLNEKSDGNDHEQVQQISSRDSPSSNFHSSTLPKFHWMERVWHNVRIGRYNKPSVAKEQLISEGLILLEVHKLTGLLDLRRENISLMDFAEQAKARGIRNYFPKINDEALKASVEYAQIYIAETIAHKLESLNPTDTTQVGSWADVLPCYTGLLMASCHRSTRMKSQELLKSMAQKFSTPDAQSETLTSLQKLMADETAAGVILQGTTSGIRLLSIYGPRYAARSHSQMCCWLQSLVSAEVPSVDQYLLSDAQGQIACLVEQYLLYATELENATFFREVTCRFLTSLKEVWPNLLYTESDADRVSRRDNFLNALLELRHCNDRAVLKNWSSLIKYVVEICGYDRSHQQKIAEMFNDLVSQRTSYPETIVKDLSVAFKVPLPSGLIWSSVSHPPMRQTKLDDMFHARSSNDDACITSSCQVAERGGMSQLGRNRERMERERLRRVETSLNLIGVLKAPHSRNRRASKLNALLGRPPTATLKKPVRAHYVNKGPSRIEQLRKEYLERKGEGGSSAPGDKDSYQIKDQIMEDLSHRRQAIRIEKKEAATPRPQHFASRDAAMAAAREQARAARKRLKPRDIHQLHDKILSFDVNALLTEPAFDSTRMEFAQKFRMSEEYVCHWESLLLREMSAQIGQCLLQEQRVASINQPENIPRQTYLARTPFEVFSPAEPRKFCKEFKIRYCGDGHLRESGPSSDEAVHGRNAAAESFSAAGCQVGDLVRLQVANRGRGHEEGQHSSSNVTLMLGCISDITFHGTEAKISVLVKFPRGFSEPGPGRAVGVSRLFNLMPQYRQFEALWRVNLLPDNLLRFFLNPKSAWKLYRKDCRDRHNFRDTSDKSALELLPRNSNLNSSQVKVLNECQRLYTSSRQADANRGGLILLQGPPGTGKTSTILAILSLLLSPVLGSNLRASHAWKKQKVHTEGYAMEVHVAPRRVIVCAPSNAAVDEILLRVMNQGLLLSSGCYASPRVVRVGGGSKYSEIDPVSINEYLGRKKRKQSKEDSLSEAGDALREAIFKRDALRCTIRSASLEIGAVHHEREQVRQSREELKVPHGTLSDSSSSRTIDDADSTEAVLTEKLKALHEKKNTLSRRLTAIEESVGLLERQKDENSVLRTTKFINGCSIVFTTLNSAGHDSLSYLAGCFDAAIVDEAAQAIEPEMLIPIVGSTSKSTSCVPFCVMVGDPMQLPATVLSTNVDVATALKTSLFERLQSARGSKTFMLQTQYRMHPDIARFPSLEFYAGRLKNGACVRTRAYHQPYHFDDGCRFGPLTFLDTSSYVSSYEKKAPNGSVSNPGDADLVAKLLLALFRVYGKQTRIAGHVAVLAPYQSQVSEIRRRLKEHKVLDAANIEVNTVDAIQGREKDIVVLSTVRGGGGVGGIGFVKDERRMNVALTRARFSLIIVGNSAALSTASKHWASQISYCQSRGCLKAVTAPHQLFPETSQKGHRALRPAQVPPETDIPGVSGAEQLLSPDSSDSEGYSSSSEIDSEEEFYMRKVAKIAESIQLEKSNFQASHRADSNLKADDDNNQDSPLPLARTKQRDMASRREQLAKALETGHSTRSTKRTLHDAGKPPLPKGDVLVDCDTDEKQQSVSLAKPLRTRSNQSLNLPQEFTTDTQSNRSVADHADLAPGKPLDIPRKTLKAQESSLVIDLSASPPKEPAVRTSAQHTAAPGVLKASLLSNSSQPRNGLSFRPPRQDDSFCSSSLCQLPSKSSFNSRTRSTQKSVESDVDKLASIKRAASAKEAARVLGQHQPISGHFSKDSLGANGELLEGPVLRSAVVQRRPAARSSGLGSKKTAQKPPIAKADASKADNIGGFSLLETAAALDRTVDALQRVQRPLAISKKKSARKR